MTRFDEHYKELFEKRKIFEEVENDDIQSNDVYAFDLLIPKAFNIAQVNTFLTYQLVELNGELVNVGIAKPAEKGKDLYDSGNTVLCEFCEIGDKIIFSANVEASMKAELYFPQVCIDRTNGNITTSKCTCEASSTGTCTHVSCVLHVILDLVALRDPKITRPCTSQVCIQYFKLGRNEA